MQFGYDFNSIYSVSAHFVIANAGQWHRKHEPAISHRHEILRILRGKKFSAADGRMTQRLSSPLKNGDFSDI